MDWSVIALIVAAVALWSTQQSNPVLEQNDNKVKNRAPSFDVRQLVYSDERIKAV